MTRTSYTPCQHLMSILCLMYCFGTLDTVILDEDNDNEIAIAHAGVGKENNTSSECVIVKDETIARAGKGKEGEEDDDKAGKGDRVDDASSAIVKMNGAVTEEVAVADVAGGSEKGMPGERQQENNAERNEGRVRDESDADGPDQAIMEEDRVVEKAKRIAIAISTVAPIIIQNRVGEGHGKSSAKDEKDEKDEASDACCADSLDVPIMEEEDRVVKDTARFEIGAPTGGSVVSGLEGGGKQNRIGNASAAVIVEDAVVDKAERVAIPSSASVPVEVEGKRAEIRMENETEGQKCRVDVASTVLGPALAVMEEDIVMDDVERVTIAGSAGTPVDIESEWGGKNEEKKAKGGRDIVDDVSTTNDPAAVALEKDRGMDGAEEVAAFISTGHLAERNCAGDEGEENKAVCEEDRVDSFFAVKGSTDIMVEEDRSVDFSRVGTGAVATYAPVVREDGQEKNNVEGGKDRVENEAEEVTNVDVGGASKMMEGEVGKGQEHNNKEAENERANDAYTIDDPLAAVVEYVRVMDESVGTSIAVTADTPVVREDGGGEGQDDTNAEGDEDGVGDSYASDVSSASVVEGENVVDEVEEVTGVIPPIAPMMQEGEGKGGLEEKNEEGKQDSVTALITTGEGDRVVDLAEEVANTVRDNGKGDEQGINNVEGGEDRVDDTAAAVVEGDQEENEAEEVTIIDVGGTSEVNEGEVGEGQEQNNKEVENRAEDVPAIDAPASVVLEDDRVMDESVGISVAVTADTSVVIEDGGGEGQDDINVDGVGDSYATDVPFATSVEGGNVVDEVEEVTGVISPIAPLMQEGEGKGGLEEENEEGKQDSVNALATTGEGDRVVDLAEEVANTVRDNGKGDGQELNNVEGGESGVDDTFAAVVEGDQVEDEAEEVTIVEVGGASEVIEGEVGEGQEQSNKEAETRRAEDVPAIDAPASVVLEDDRVMHEAEGVSIAVTDDTSVVIEDRGGEGQDDINAEGDEDVIGDPYATDVSEGEKVVDEVEEDTGVNSPVAPLIQEGEGKEELEEDNGEGEQDSVNALTTTSEVDRVVASSE